MLTSRVYYQELDHPILSIYLSKQDKPCHATQIIIISLNQFDPVAHFNQLNQKLKDTINSQKNSLP